MKINITKLLDIESRIKRESVLDNTTDGSSYANKTGGTSLDQAYSFELEIDKDMEE